MCLAANEIDEIAGILNGTTNFILTKMIKEGTSFDEALKTAQDLGYAERNPAADVEGYDACRKICILASLAFGRHVYPEYVHTEGITKITLEDVAYAESWGGVIKLIGEAKRIPESERIECLVAPAFVNGESQLANIDDVFNGVLVRGNATGDVVFYGKGAGKLPTASAVVADVIHEAKVSGTSTSLTWKDSSENFVLPYDEVESAFYVRAAGFRDSSFAKERISVLFHGASFLSRAGQPESEAAFVTESMSGGLLMKKVEALKEKGAEILSVIRVADC